VRNFRRLTSPQSAHPLVRKLVDLMNHEQMGLLDLADRSGINKNTIKDWRTRTVPTLDNFDACLSVLGYELTVTRKKEKN
jgi:transposase-like protein